MENASDAKLVEILQNEKFVAFFDFCLVGENGESELDGLCKVALARYLDQNDYISLTFIFDTPSEGKRALAKRIVSKLTPDSFKKLEPSVYAVTSVPGTMRQTENYIHNMDVMFNKPIRDNMREIVKKLVFSIRAVGGLDTEVPQWWEENDAPAPSEAEKANWGARIKAFLGLKK